MLARPVGCWTPWASRCGSPVDAPLLSVVVPTYDVEDLVGECLRSLLDQRAAGVEVIAVDDCSTDRSGAVLDELARHHPELRVLHLPENRGLGGAREAGLAEAAGEYVWFVDSDDWVDERSLERIVARLAGDRPDVLVIGHALAHPDGRAERAPDDVHLRGLPTLTSPSASPSLFRTFPSAWNKVVRRRLLVALDVPFPSGIYEDIPVLFPVLCAADTVGVLDEICLYYRQRPGSILRSAGAQHLQVLDQWELAFDRLEALGPGRRRLVPHVYASMVQQLFLLLGTGRMGAAERRRFFAGASELVRRRRPAGYRPPGGVEGVRDRLLRTGRFRLAWAVRSGYQLAKRAGSRPRPTVPKPALAAYYLAQTRRPIEPDLALYSAYWGRGYACNPAAIDAAARRLAPWVRNVWVAAPGREEHFPADVEVVVDGTPAYYRALARARYLVNNANFGNVYRKRRGTTFLQTHHGTPLKAMGVDEPPDPATGTSRRVQVRRLLRRCAAWDFDLSANRYSTEVWHRAYPVDFTTLEYGYPRNDVLVTATEERARRCRAELGIEDDETVVLYAPTHRGEHVPHEWLLDPDAFAAELPGRHRLLVRAHYFHTGTTGPRRGARVSDVSAHPCIEDLYLAADVLLTDYSSTMFDYALLDRPIVIYAPDWDEYRATRGTYFDLSAEAPGLFARDLRTVVDAFRSGSVDAPEHQERRRAFRARFCQFDDGLAAERVVRRLLLGEDPEPPGQMP